MKLGMISERARVRPGSQLGLAIALALLLPLSLTLVATPASAVTLGVTPDGRFFTIDGEPRFLAQVSYYGAQTISDPALVAADLDDLVADGFNSIRVWLTWADPANGENVSVITKDGIVRQPYMDRLKDLLAEADRRGVIVDCSLTRDGVATVHPSNQAQHLAAVQALASELLPYRNVYIDVANERDITDDRFVSLGQVGALIDAIHAIDPDRLATASGNPTSQAEIDDYIRIAKLDLIAPHLCRTASCPSETLGTVNTYVGWMNNLGSRVPVHLQEPFRRGWNNFTPVAEDFFRDAGGGKIAEAAGWCFHNGPESGGRPFRSFSMSGTEGRLYAQLDAVELSTAARLLNVIGGTDWDLRRYQAEYAEQHPHGIGQKDGFSWAARAATDPAGALARGPDIATLAPGPYEVRFTLDIDDNQADNDAVAILEVNDIDAASTLATRTVTRQEFVGAGVWQRFVLTFDYTVPGNRIELRVRWLDKADMRLDRTDLQLRRAAVAPDFEVCLADYPTAPLGSVLYATITGPARIDALTGERYRDSAALEAGTSWDFSGVTGDDTILQYVPADPAWGCSVTGGCPGFGPGRASVMRVQDHTRTGDRDAWGFASDASRVLLTGMAFQEGEVDEERWCFGNELAWLDFSGPGACLTDADATWNSAIGCDGDITQDDPCGVGAPLVDIDAVYAGRVVRGGTLRLPSGHVLDALLTESRFAGQLSAPGVGCAAPVVDVSSYVLSWLVPWHGTVVQLRSSGDPVGLDWDSVDDIIVGYGLLPPLSIRVTAATSGSATVSWQPGARSHYDDEYIVHWGEQQGMPDNSSELVGDTIPAPQTSYTIRGLAPDTTYHLSVTTRSRYTDPVSMIETTYDSIALPRSVGADVDGDGVRETSYPPETAVTTSSARADLLRSWLADIRDPRAPVLPLEPLRDAYLSGFLAGDPDPDPGVFGNPARPLMFYAVDAATTLLLVKAPGPELRVFF